MQDNQMKEFLALVRKIETVTKKRDKHLRWAKKMDAKLDALTAQLPASPFCTPPDRTKEAGA